MRLLIVSGKEYSVSNRGIDVITTFLSKNNEIDHLLFYTRNQLDSKEISKNINQCYFIDQFKLYKDKFKYFMPSFILDYIFKMMVEKSKFDFSKYDYVILESGYPILLHEFIDNKIIYRQSDPTEIAFNTNRAYFKKKEISLLKKAYSVSTAIEPYLYPDIFKPKTTFWRSGFLNIQMENKEKKNQIVYMGGTPIDYGIIKSLANRYNNYDFIIIGKFKDTIHKKNVIFTGYQNFDSYKDYILQSKIFFLPIKNTYLSHMKNFGFTSKFYLPLSLGIPIVCRKHGVFTENDLDKKIFIYKNKTEAFRIFDDLIIQGMFQNFSVSDTTSDFLKKQSIEYKENELNEYFKKILYNN